MKVPLRVWILIMILILSLLAIKPRFEKGVVVTSIDENSKLFEQGMRKGEIIKEINGEKIPDKNSYSSVIRDIYQEASEHRLELKTKKDSYVIISNQTPEISIENLPKTNLKTGLDLRGGARALVQPDSQLTDEQLQDLVSVSRNRFNVYGLSDVNIKGVSDLLGNKFILIEVAGATPNDLEQLVSQQGKFEAKIANQTVFEGGKKDISDVCRNDASCAGIARCDPATSGYVCEFRFVIYLREEAAQRHAKLTANLSLDETGQYLTESLYLFVDDKEVDSLRISSELRGRATTEVSIQGSGTGATQEEAIKDARESMSRLQTILLTGSLPYKLTIVKLDTISPTLGQNFTSAIFIAAIVSIFGVAILIFARYRKFKASLALLFTSFSELIIILGVAALIKWNLDLPSIAGILATLGTGVDQQIIMIDEAGRATALSIKQRMKRAFSIILSAYLTVVVAMIPLYWAGAGLFKGFALTTIIGVTAGILVTRPAFGEILKKIEEKNIS